MNCLNLLVGIAASHLGAALGQERAATIRSKRRAILEFHEVGAVLGLGQDRATGVTQSRAALPIPPAGAAAPALGIGALLGQEGAALGLAHNGALGQLQDVRAALSFGKNWALGVSKCRAARSTLVGAG